MKRILRRLIRYANIFFAILLVLSALSPNVNPSRLWGPSFLGLSYPYILLINILFLLFWIFNKKPEFILSFLAILFGWHTLTDYIGLHPGALFKRAYYESRERPDRNAEMQLKVMSFNVRAFDLYGWTGNPSAREDIYGLIRNDDPDILCLQEFFYSEREDPGAVAVNRELGDPPYRHIEYTINIGRNKYGIAIFSHYPIVNSGKVDLDNPLSICSYADIRVFEDTVRVYNMHLESIRLSSQHYRLIDSLRFRYNNQQMEEIRDISSRLRNAFVKRAVQSEIIAAHIAESPYPVLVCGDFNDTPVSYSYRQVREGLSDAFSECGFGIGRTYNGKFPSFRIDFILYGDDFGALHFRRKKVRLSDHFPVTAHLQYIDDDLPGERIRGWIIAD